MEKEIWHKVLLLAVLGVNEMTVMMVVKVDYWTHWTTQHTVGQVSKNKGPRKETVKCE